MEPFQQLEKDFGEWAGVENVVCCASGTAALHLAIEALRLPRLGKVLLSDFNMIACARAVTLADMQPVFVDCDESLLLDTSRLHAFSLREAVAGEPASSRCDLDAILATHIYGRRCNMEAIHYFAKRYKLAVIEDLAEAHGVKPHPETDAACWSFYRNKIVGGEEGGAVAFRDPETATLARQLRCLGFTPEHDFMHVPRGHNYRMSNANASLILDSLHCVEANVKERRHIERWYDLRCPDEWMMPPRAAPWVYDVRIPGLHGQDAVVSELQAAGIQARHAFKPMSVQPEYRGPSGANAVRLAGEVIYLPLQPGMTEETADVAFDVLERMLC